MALYYARYSVSEFSEFISEYVKPDNLACLWKPFDSWVFWSRENDGSQELESLDRIPSYQCPISERIQYVLKRFHTSPFWVSVLQFWAPERRGDRCFLTTCNQPFMLGALLERLCRYRKRCMSQDIDISQEGDEQEEGKDQIGPIGRAFFNRRPELTPDVKYYSLQEFPLRDDARFAGLSSLYALPVFEVSDKKNCVGVFEFAGYERRGIYVSEQELQEVGLTFNLRDSHPDPMAEQDSLEEIKRALEVVVGTFPCPLALAFFSSRSSGNDESCYESSDLGLLGLAICRDTFDLWDFFDICTSFSLQKGKGVSGKALASQKSFFCTNIYDLSINDYPFVHYVRDVGLAFSIAICLETRESENDLVVLEFFLLPGNDNSEYNLSMLESLLTKLEQHLKNFRIISKDVLEEVHSKVINSSNDNKVDVLPITQSSRHPSRAQIWQHGKELEQLYSVNKFVLFSNGHYKDYKSNLVKRAQPKLVDYMMPAKLAFPEKPRCLVFWSRESNESQALDSPDGIPFHNLSISERIKDMLHLVGRNSGSCLTQFWSPIWRGGRCFLTTSNQPFVLKSLRRNYYSYRRQCLNLNIYVAGEGDEREKQEKLGPVGRAFCKRQPEFSPNVQHYSLQEFPLRDFALLCGLRVLIALPVFESHSQNCVGVLECLIAEKRRFKCNFESSDKALREVDLSLYNKYFNPLCAVMLARQDSKGWQDSRKEIDFLFEVVAQTYPLYMALAFVPLRSGGNDGFYHDSSDSGFLRLAFYTSWSLDSYFVQAHRSFYLQKGKGVSGKAFGSQKSWFCKNISNLSMAEHPFVHCARKDGLTLSFAVFLQATQRSNHPMVLEFFLLPGNYSYEHIYSVLGSLLTTISQHLQSFTIASDDVPIEEVFPKVMNVDEVDCSWIMQYSGHMLGLQILQSDKEMELLDITDRDLMLEGNESNAYVTCKDNKVRMKRTKVHGKGKKLDLSYDDLKQHFGKSLDEVATSLGVSISSIMRISKKYGIIRWQFREENEESLRDFGRITSQGTMTLNSEIITEKATYGENSMVKFKVPFTSKLAELEDEVSKQLKLKVGSFSVMYQDEDNDWISVTCDADLQYCGKILSLLGGTTIRMLVKLNSK